MWERGDGRDVRGLNNKVKNLFRRPIRITGRGKGGGEERQRGEVEEGRRRGSEEGTRRRKGEKVKGRKGRRGGGEETKGTRVASIIQPGLFSQAPIIYDSYRADNVFLRNDGRRAPSSDSSK
eukprot:350033-Karenia_brevis.AAC.1